MNLSMQHKGTFFVVITLSIWGLFAVFSRMLGGQQLNAWDLTFLRFAVAVTVLLVWIFYKRETLNFRIKPALILSLFGGVGYCLIVYAGFLYAPVSHAAIWLNACIPVSTFFLSWVFFKKNLQIADYWTVLLIISSIVGMLLYGYSTQNYQFSIGDICFFVGSIFWASYTLLVKHLKISIREALVGVTITSFVCYTPIYLLFLPKKIMAEQWSIIVMQGFFHGVLMMLVASMSYIKAIEYLGAMRAGSILALAPFLAVILAIPLLGEWPDISALIGLSGLLVAVLKPWQWFRKHTA